MLVTVNTATLSQPAFAARVASKCPDYLTGARFALETLGIPLPAPLQRKAPGRKPRAPS